MFKTKEKVTTDQASRMITAMFSRLSVKDRNQILRLIDEFVLEDLKIPRRKVPWLNSDKRNIDDFPHVLDLMRLSYARLVNDDHKEYIKNIH